MINSTSDFLAIFDEEEAQDYILMSDIELTDFTLLSNSSLIRSLDGNNKKIVIKSFNLSSTSTTLNLALFNTISDSTTLKNLIVDYSEVGEISYSNSTQ
jgi:hypothetical protein